MPVTREQVEKALSVDEPDYTAAARLGVGALPHLNDIIRDADPGLGAKAVYLASLIENGDLASVIDVAARHTDPVLRVAAASALNRVPANRLIDIAIRLLSDQEDGVRRRALASISSKADPKLNQQLNQLADSLPEGETRSLVIDACRKLSDYRKI